MKNEFIKKNMTYGIMRKATSAIPFLRSAEMGEKEISEFLRDYDRKGDGNILKTMAETGQDPKEIEELFIEALEDSINILKERALKSTKILFSEVSKRVKLYAEQKNS